MLNETFSVIFKHCTCILGTSNDALNNLTRCRVCWGEIGPGKHQVCGKAKRYENLMDDLSPMTRQVLASEILKEQFQNDGQESATLKCRHGPRLEVRSKNVKDETAVFTTEKMDKFRSQIHMSKRNALKTARFFKEVFNGEMETGMQEYVYDANTCLSDFFTVERCEFLAFDYEFNDGKPVSSKKTLQPVFRDIVYCTDVEGLIFFLKVTRVLDDDCIVKIGLDGGQGSLKLCLTIHSRKDEEKSPPSKRKRKSALKRYFFSLA